jgi:hypothetical protein
LPAVIAAILASPSIQSQEEESPEAPAVENGMYTVTDEGKTYVIQGGEVLELDQGEAAFVREGELRRIDYVPEFMEWPCTSVAANARKFATYSMDELKEPNPMKEVVRRYFEIPEVIEPIPNWIDGEFHGTFNANDIIQFNSPEYWYLPDPNKPIMAPKRPTALLISLYVGTSQIVPDSHVFDALVEMHGWDQIPVVFKFNDSNVVPISYFGPNVSLEELFKAFMERRIKPAEVPMWPLGDHHLSTTIEEFEKFFEIPTLDEIDPGRLSKLQADLEANGFSRKPVFVTVLAESGPMIVDDEQRIRAAQALGIERIPTVVFFIEPDSHLAGCGPGIPIGSSGVTGATTPIGGATVPPTSGVTPPPPEPEASDS